MTSPKTPSPASAVVRVGTEETHGEQLVVDLFVRPGGVVVGEHLHPAIEERFTVVSGTVGFLVAEPPRQLGVPPHTPHDWWNAGDETAHVRVEIRPAARFEEMVTTLFRLARDGQTDAKGRPHLLQLALFAREYDDVLRLTRPPRRVQHLLFAVLAPVARLLGYRGTYPQYRDRPKPGAAPASPAPKDLVSEKVG